MALRLTRVTRAFVIFHWLNVLTNLTIGLLRATSLPAVFAITHTDAITPEHVMLITAPFTDLSRVDSVDNTTYWPMIPASLVTVAQRTVCPRVCATTMTVTQELPKFASTPRNDTRVKVDP